MAFAACLTMSTRPFEANGSVVGFCSLFRPSGENIRLGLVGELAEIALTVARPLANNPRPVTLEDAVAIYEDAF